QTTNRLARLMESLLPTSTYRFGVTKVEGKRLVYAEVDEAPSFAKPIRLATGDALEMRDGVVANISGTMEGRAELRTQLTATRGVRMVIAMSFRDEEEPALVDYWEAIKRAVIASKLSIDPIRMDLKEGDYEISQEIMDEIDRVDIVLADFTLSPA